MAYSQHLLRGLSWHTVLKVAVQSLAYLRIYLLAQIFSPAQFGQIGIVFLLLAFLEIATDGGVQTLVVQHDSSFLKQRLNALFSFSVTRGLVIAAIMVVLSPFISTWTGETSVQPLLLLAAVVPIIQGFCSPAWFTMQRDLLFRKKVMFEFVVQLSITLITVGVAFWTRSLASFVWGMMAGQAAQVILSWTRFPDRPTLNFDPSQWKIIFSRGKWMTITGVSSYAFHQGDDWVVTKLLGTQALGLYQMAYKFSAVLILQVTDIFSQALFPVYTKIQGDRDRLWKAFLKVSGTITVVSIAAGAVVIVMAEPVVHLALPSEWKPIIPLIKWLAVFGAFRSVTTSVSSLFLAVKKQEYLTWLTIVSTVAMFISILPLVQIYGLIGAIWAALIGSVAAVPLIIWGVYRVFKNKD